MNSKINIPFSPPDVGSAEIAQVVDTLQSGWLTTGPRTKKLESKLAAFIGTPRVACASSATCALECALRLLKIGPGDEVITSAYTYTASASPVCHVGATLVLCDCAEGSYEMDYKQLQTLITPKTKAIIPVDIAGVMCNYDAIFNAIEQAGAVWHASSELQDAIGRIAVVADGAHSLGATRHGVHAGQAADFTTFSFHAVKNLTTAEGGALTWREGVFDDEALYKQCMLMQLHGQTKDALSKTRAGAWEYDVAFPGYKCNMTDIQAAIGLAQLERFPALLAKRRMLIARYEQNLAGEDVCILKHYTNSTADSEQAALSFDIQQRNNSSTFNSSGHLMLVRMLGKTANFRNRVIELMSQAGVASNVHYKPLPLLTAYKNLGFNIQDFPNAYAQFENEITLPLHTQLSLSDVDTICEAFCNACKQAASEGL